MRWINRMLEPEHTSRDHKWSYAFGRQKSFCSSARLPILAVAVVMFCVVSTANAQHPPAPPNIPKPPAAPLPPPPPSSQPSAPPAAPSPAQELRFTVLLDPAHGGTDNGAMLASGMPEKNDTLALAIRLRALLSARGIRSILTRTNDSAIDNRTRAVVANRAHAAACILLHATASGNGVHLFTSSLPAAETQISGNSRRGFIAWRTAQASYGTDSLRLESDLNMALGNQHVPTLLDKTSLAPLDSLACPAVAVEVAPLDSQTPATNAAYQQRVAQALATALTAWRGDWGKQP